MSVDDRLGTITGEITIDGKPGESKISICDDLRNFSETKTVIVDRDSETTVSFVIDPSASKTRD